MAFTTMHDEFLMLMTKDIALNTSVKLDLYTNNYTPLRGDLFAAYTLGAWPGYAQQAWTIIPFQLSGHKHSWLPSVPSFPAPTSGGSVNLYGAVASCTFVLDGGAPRRAIWGYRFPAAPVALAVGDPNFVFTAFLRWFDSQL